MGMIPKNQLNGEDVRALTERLLREHLSLAIEGYKVTTSMVLNGRVKAAIEQRSIDAVCADLAGVVDGNTLREALNRTLTVEQLHQHEAGVKTPAASPPPPPGRRTTPTTRRRVQMPPGRPACPTRCPGRPPGRH